MNLILNKAYKEAQKINGAKVRINNKTLTIYVETNQNLAKVSKTFNEIFVLAESFGLKTATNKNIVLLSY